MPTVSIVVPNYNHARYLRKRMDSIFAQSYHDFEVILLDDGSTDESREILSSYAGEPRVKMAFNEENSGSVFRQWNKGAGMASGRLLWFAESDDFAEPRFLERMVRILEEQPQVTFAFCRSWTVGENDVRCGYADWYFERLERDRWSEDFVAAGLEECRRSFVICAPVPNASAALVRREAYEKVGGPGEQLRLCGDYKLWASLALEGKVAYVSEPLNSYRTHSYSVRVKTQSGMVDIAEYFYVMRWVIERAAPAETLAGRPRLEEIYERLPAEMDPGERVRAARRALSEVADWNLRNNKHVSRERMQAYFRDWEFALIGKEFELSPPNRWDFFWHRVHFYRRYSVGMDWKEKIANLMRVVGAPLVGYKNRHWPEEMFARTQKLLAKPEVQPDERHEA